MNDKERIAEWLHFYGLLMTNDAKWQLFHHLREDGSPSAREALRQLLKRWEAE